MELININLAANETKQFRKAGATIEIIESMAAIGVNLYSVQGSQTNSIKGGMSGMFLNANFGAFDVTNGPTAQNIILLVCDDGESGGSRRQPGNVRVIDQGYDKTREGAQFLTMQQRTAAAGLYPIVGVLAVTKKLAIKRLQVTASAAGQVAIGYCTAQPTMNGGNSGAGLANNKLYGGPANDHVRIFGDCAGVNPTTGELPGYLRFGYGFVNANMMSEIPMTTPIILMPGSGIVVVGNQLAGTCAVIADTEELAY